jgi:hypothetical protein
MGWQRLADVQVPYGILWVILVGTWLRKRGAHKAIQKFAVASSGLGTLLGTQWRENAEREKQLLELQTSVENLTRWLVRLTIALGIIGLSGIAATVLAALKQRQLR